jgi:putative membrane protein
MMGMGMGMIFNMIFWILIVGFSIYGIVLLVMKPFEKKEDKALEVLKERFARGEIDEHEYKEKKQVLTQK